MAHVLTRTQRNRTAAVAAAVIVGLLLWLFVHSDVWQGQPTTYEATWSGRSAPGIPPSISANGEHVTLTYTGGACDDHADVDVAETPGTVTLTIAVTEDTGRDCSAIGIRKEIVAELQSPVAGRELIDGAA
jgi:hypothetical protein